MTDAPSATGPQPDTAPLHTLHATELSKQEASWMLTLYQDHLTLTPEGTGPADPPSAAPYPGYPQPPPGAVPPGYVGQPSQATPKTGVLVVTRDQIGEQIIVHEGWPLAQVVELRRPGEKKRLLKLGSKEHQRVQKWVGPPTRSTLAAELKRRVSFLIPIGLFFAVTSLPCPGDAASGAAAIPMNPIGLTLGAGLVVIYLVGRLHPRPWVFLLDALWWVGLGADNVHAVTRGSSHAAWLAFVPLTAYFAWGAYQRYKRFAHVN